MSIALQLSLALAQSHSELRAQAASQAPEKSANEKLVQRIFDEELLHGRAFPILAELLHAAPKRLAGSPGAAAAVAWAKGELEKDRAENVHLEACTVPHWVRGDHDALTFANGGEKLAMMALGGSVGTNKGGITAGVVEVVGRDALAKIGDRAKGKFLFFNEPMDKTQLSTFDAYGKAVWQRGSGASEAAKVGAVGAIVRSMTTRTDDLPHTGAMHYADGVDKVPAVAISTVAADRLSAMLAKGETPSLHLELGCQTLPDEPSSNVIAEVRGREKPDEIVVIGGHLDAWEAGDGAHDDGTGIAHVVEAVRLLEALDLHPRRTIRAVLYMNEENGLRGGRAYADAHAKELDKHVFALETDRGGFAPRGFAADESVRPILAPLAALLAPWGAGGMFEGGGGADTSTLDVGGVPQGELIPEDSRYFDMHHCPRDVLDQVNERELALGAASVAAFAYLVADLPETLPRATAPKKK